TTITTLLDADHTLFIEASPHPVLTIGINDTIDTHDTPAIAIGTLRRDEGGLVQMLTAAGHAHTTGLPIHWPLPQTTPVDLPTYPFQHRVFPLPSTQLPTGAGAAGVPDTVPVDEPDDALDTSSSLVSRLAGLTRGEQEAVLLELVRSRAAVVLGHASPHSVTADETFKAQGFDSLGAVELRDRIAAETGLRLPPTGIFNYPTPVELARHLRGRLMGENVEDVITEAISVAGSEDPIVIVGMACRYPGGVSSPEELWQLLADGREA
ncbi:acyl carrier protein, partial [Streptomyces mayteni]